MKRLSLFCLLAVLLQSGCASSPGYIVHTNDASEPVSYTHLTLPTTPYV